MNRTARRTILSAAPVLFVAAFFLLPLAEVLRLGLLGDSPLAKSWEDIWGQAYHRNRVLFTAYQALLSTLLTLAVGVPLAYLFATYTFPGRRTLRALFTAPFVLPPLVVAVALQSAFGSASWIHAAFGMDLLYAFGPVGAILIAHTYYNVSVVMRIVGTALERIPSDLAESARTLGATPLRAFARVQAPLVAPAIFASAALVFLFTLTSFGIIILLGGPHLGTIETLIWDNVRSFVADYPRAAILGLLQLAATLAAVALYLRFHRATRVPHATRPAPSRRRLPTWGWAALLPAGAFLIGPAAALALAAFSHRGQPSLEGFRLLASSEFPLGSYTVASALQNSILFGAATTLGAVTLALLTLLALRSRRQILPHAFFLAPLGASPVLAGLGLLLAYDGQPLPDLRSHPARIVAAHVLVAYPFVTRVLAPSFDALWPPIREAARTLGAGPLAVLRRIELPLLAPSLRGAAAFAFAISLGEFGATLLLRRPEFSTIPLALFDALGRPGAAYAAQAEALAFLLLAAASGAFFLLERAPRTHGGGLL